MFVYILENKSTLFSVTISHEIDIRSRGSGRPRYCRRSMYSELSTPDRNTAIPTDFGKVDNFCSHSPNDLARSAFVFVLSKMPSRADLVEPWKAESSFHLDVHSMNLPEESDICWDSSEIDQLNEWKAKGLFWKSFDWECLFHEWKWKFQYLY